MDLDYHECKGFRLIKRWQSLDLVARIFVAAYVGLLAVIVGISLAGGWSR